MPKIEVYNPKLLRPDKIDPTRTSGLRRAFQAELGRRFAHIRKNLYHLIARMDALGLKEKPSFANNSVYVYNNIWKFKTSSEQVNAFQQWMTQQFQLVTEEHDRWDEFVTRGFAKGAGQAFDKVRLKALRKKRPELFTPEAQDQLRDFYIGSKDEFLRSSFGQPESVDKLKLLAGRTFDDLQGITQDTSRRLARLLTQGLSQGQNPRDIARTLTQELDLGKKRSMRIARTEIVRAHAEGTLVSLKQLGVAEVGVTVEWSTSDLGVTAKGYPSPCKLCAPLKGVVLTIEKAAGLLPRHPNCLCAWIPAGVGEEDEDQKKTTGRIKSAIRKSIDRERSSRWAGATVL